MNEMVDLYAAAVATPRSWFWVFDRGHADAPIGAHNSGGGDVRNASIPGLTLANEKSFVVSAIQVKAADEVPGVISGTTTVAAGVGFRGAHAGPIASWGSKSIPIETSPSPQPGDPLPDKRYVSLVCEVVSV